VAGLLSASASAGSAAANIAFVFLAADQGGASADARMNVRNGVRPSTSSRQMLPQLNVKLQGVKVDAHELFTLVSSELEQRPRPGQPRATGSYCAQVLPSATGNRCRVPRWPTQHSWAFRHD
jgi:hypothetical protein